MVTEWLTPACPACWPASWSSCCPVQPWPGATSVTAIICEIAFQELEPTARERVKELIRRDPEFDTFAEACSWPDHPRRRAEEHYVNLPRDAEGLEEDPCPLATDCVVTAIEKDLAVLSSSSATEQERLEALKTSGTGSATSTSRSTRSSRTIISGS